jgi:hypothetical protein
MVTTFPIKLEHEDLLPGSEVITSPGGFVALVRDEDYTMDYVNGIVSIILTGKVGQLPGAGSTGLDLNITYRRRVDFEKDFFLESHVEVFSEVATVTDTFEIQVANSPIGDIFRVFNKTTGEEYTVDSFLDKTIFIAGLNAPRVLDLTDQPAEIRNREIVSNSRFNVMAALILPEELTPAKEHPISIVGNVDATTGFKFLVQGGVDILKDTYVFEITPEVNGIEIVTGSRSLRTSTQQLVINTDFTAITDEDLLTLTITLTDAGLAAIGTNSAFYRLVKLHRVREQNLFDGEDLLDTEHRITFCEEFVSEVTTFGPDGFAPLTKFEPFIEIDTEVDRQVFPTIIVTNQSGTITFVEGIDYTIDTAFRRLVRVATSPNLAPLGQTVKVIFIENESLSVDSLTIAQDVVIVDYDYGTNSINWSPSFVDEPIQEIRRLSKDTRFFRLERFPTDENVEVFLLSDDDERSQQINVVTVDVINRRVQIEPAPATTNYAVEYVAREQTFDPGVNYFVDYNFGARKRALIDNFGALVGLTTGTVIRTETFDLINKQSSVQLSFAPTDPSRVVIYVTGDPDKSLVTTVREFDPATNTLHFVPIISAANYTVEYPVVGFCREELRKAIISLIKSFRLGATKASVEQLVKALTDLTPDVVEAITSGFELGPGTDFLKPLPAIASPEQSDGTPSIAFVPSRFNNGLELRSSRNAWVGYGALNNLRVQEGTFSFLLGTFWDGDDGQTHQMFDMVGTDEFTNRITLYKNKRNSLVFEVHDEKSNLYRITTDVTRVPRNEIIFLQEGQSSAQLQFSPANTIVDFDADGQADIFGANRTEFIITPVFGGIQGLGVNITTLIQIPDDPAYLQETPFVDVATKLRTLANIYEQNNAKLTIQTELSFIKGCQLFENVLADLELRGHEVSLFIDLPQDIISDQARIDYILQRRNELATLGIGGEDEDGVAGGYEIANFATQFPALGFEYASAFVDPLSGETLENRTDVFRASAGPDFSKPDPDGELVYIPGDMDIDFQKNPMIVQSFIPITNSLLTAVNVANLDVVNSWYFRLNINDFTIAEITLFEQWLVNTVNPLVQSGQVFWRTLKGTFKVFREFEEFLEVNRNRVRFVTDTYGNGYGGYGGLQAIRALQWDEVTNTLTFDPKIEKAGFYLFSYISGWSAYEEAEHLVTATWKLHTDDMQPAIIRLFVDGELVNHRIFGDL